MLPPNKSSFLAVRPPAYRFIPYPRVCLVIGKIFCFTRSKMDSPRMELLCNLRTQVEHADYFRAIGRQIASTFYTIPHEQAMPLISSNLAPVVVILNLT